MNCRLLTRKLALCGPTWTWARGTRDGDKGARTNPAIVMSGFTCYGPRDVVFETTEDMKEHYKERVAPLQSEAENCDPCRRSRARREQRTGVSAETDAHTAMRGEGAQRPGGQRPKHDALGPAADEARGQGL